MTDKQIIERLILELENLIPGSPAMETKDAVTFINKLEATGRFKVYPVYTQQSEQDKSDIRVLLNMEPGANELDKAIQKYNDLWIQCRDEKTAAIYHNILVQLTELKP